jgi:elongation factor G
MKEMTSKDIRNVAILGHGSEGKTTLAEAMLFTAGAIERQGRVEDGATTTDFDTEEVKRHISISAAVAPLEWKDTKINLVDIPGYFDFAGEMVGPLAVCEGAIILVGAVSGLTGALYSAAPSSLRSMRRRGLFSSDNSVSGGRMLPLHRPII